MLIRSPGRGIGFSIRSFGSWGEATRRRKVIVFKKRFSIRSFGSWGEAPAPSRPSTGGHHVSVSALSDRGVRQLKIYIRRIRRRSVSVSALSDRGVRPNRPSEAVELVARVSVSALSDRGVRPWAQARAFSRCACFSIRSFGSWGEAITYNA